MAAIKLYVSPDDKFAFVGDVHFDINVSSRLDNYLDTCCGKIEAIGCICQKEGVRYVFFAGDIFNKVNCSHECVNRAGQAFLSLQKKGLRLFAICGNHDLLRNELRQICKVPAQTLFGFGALEHVSLLAPVEVYKTAGDGGGVMSAKITACDYTQAVPPADKDFDINILLAHMFFAKGSMLAASSENIPKQVMETSGYDMAFLGHDHEEYMPAMCGNTLVVRCGSLLRGTAHDYNFQREPGFVIVDSIFEPQNVRKVVIPYCPYKDIISQAVLNRKTPIDASPDGVDYDALRDLAGKLAEARAKDSSTEDIVLKTIEEDPQVPDACRRILLDYIRKAG